MQVNYCFIFNLNHQYYIQNDNVITIKVLLS